MRGHLSNVARFSIPQKRGTTAYMYSIGINNDLRTVRTLRQISSLNRIEPVKTADVSHLVSSRMEIFPYLSTDLRRLIHQISVC